MPRKPNLPVSYPKLTGYGRVDSILKTFPLDSEKVKMRSKNHIKIIRQRSNSRNTNAFVSYFDGVLQKIS